MSTTPTIFPPPEQVDGILVGPESVTWRRASDSRLYLVMLYALLLQVAHPTVGAGVHDYSDFERRPWNRLLRTIDYVTLLVYGGGDAVPAGRRLRELHKRFKGVRPDGERYNALEPEAYAWVHATLIETYVAGHEHFGSPMRGAELEAFYREYRQLGRLIGVRDRDLPETWAGFREYFDAVASERLQRTAAVDQVLQAVHRVPPPPVPVPELVWRAVRVPASTLLRLGSLGLMDPALRARLGIRWTGFDETRFRAMGAATRSLGPVMPKRLKVMGPAQLKWRRQAIARGPLGDPA
ncbi:MAG TPA: oxygenase MpaB family protein [Solirubrobacteraceae bacterium]|nr:oxygenase MpaB family protein [Solirubrobacteraceae bacterium]